MKKIINLYKKYEEIVNYVIVGVLTTIVSLSSYYLLVTFLFNPKNPILLQISNIISWIFAVTFAYFTNKKYVFKSKKKNKSEFIKFYLARVTTLLLDMGIMFLLASVLKMNDKISKLIVQFVVFVGNYLLSKFVVFNGKQDKFVNFIKNNWIYILVYLVLFIILVFCHSNTFVANDDLAYSFFKRLNDRVSNLFEIVWDNLRYYKSTNGRFLVHCIVLFLLMFGKSLWAILNPIMILFLPYIIIKFLNSKNKIINVSVILLTYGLFLSLYRYKYALYWVAGSVNYLWVLCLVFLFSYLILKKDILKHKKISFVCLVILSSLHENSFVYLLIFITFYSIIKAIKEKNYKYFLFLIPVLIGGGILLLAPGNLKRNSAYASWYALSFFKRLNISIPFISDSIYKFLSLENIILIIFVIMIILKLIFLKTNKKNEKIIKFFSIFIILILIFLSILCPFKYLTFIIALALLGSELFIHIVENDLYMISLELSFYAVTYSMIITPLYYALRPNLYLYIYYIFIICKFLVDLIKNKKVLCKVILIITILFSITMSINEVLIYYNIGIIKNKRENEIKEFNKNGNGDILYLSKIPKEYTMYHTDSNMINEDHWTYKYFIWYYGIKEGTKIKYK